MSDPTRQELHGLVHAALKAHDMRGVAAGLQLLAVYHPDDAAAIVVALQLAKVRSDGPKPATRRMAATTALAFVLRATEDADG